MLLNSTQKKKKHNTFPHWNYCRFSYKTLFRVPATLYSSFLDRSYWIQPFYICLSLHQHFYACSFCSSHCSLLMKTKFHRSQVIQENIRQSFSAVILSVTWNHRQLIKLKWNWIYWIFCCVFIEFSAKFIEIYWIYATKVNFM